MTEIIAIKTRCLIPPQDSLTDALDTALPDLANGDILVLSSKVVAIDEGRCISKKGITKSDLVHNEADAYIPKSFNKYGFELSIIHHALIASAGVDASNCGDYFTLLPKSPFESAKKWHSRLCKKFNLSELGIIIADSHSLPMRWGVVDISIGFWGFNPLKDYRGTNDLFGNELRVSQGNIVDAIAAAAGGIMGQGIEQTPAVLFRGWPGVVFDSETDYSAGFLIPHEEDIFNILLDVFKQKGIMKDK